MEYSYCSYLLDKCEPGPVHPRLPRHQDNNLFRDPPYHQPARDPPYLLRVRQKDGLFFLFVIEIRPARLLVSDMSMDTVSASSTIYPSMIASLNLSEVTQSRSSQVSAVALSGSRLAYQVRYFTMATCRPRSLLPSSLPTLMIHHTPDILYCK